MSPIMSLYKYISTHAYITIYLIHIICDRKEKRLHIRCFLCYLWFRYIL